jgi:hypothetical protein
MWVSPGWPAGTATETENEGQTDSSVHRGPPMASRADIVAWGCGGRLESGLGRQAGLESAVITADFSLTGFEVGGLGLDHYCPGSAIARWAARSRV